MPGDEITRVDDDTRAFYGRNYWFGYQEELGHPSIIERARTDLSDRCLHWLRTLLKYLAPPARVLEVGSGHGGFVLLLRRAGFEAMGLELSPWVVDFARRTFGVPMLLGRLEDQALPPGSFDGIVMMDVVEHLPDPVGTIGAAVERLYTNGTLLVQTPCVPPGISFEDMVASGHPFLPLLRERGHLYLFTAGGLRQLFERVGLGHVAFEPAIFAEYDMFAVGSRRPPAVSSDDARGGALTATPDARLVQALLDLDDRARRLARRHQAAEADRAARLDVITAQAERLVAAEADRAARLDVINEQAERLAASEADRAARLDVINEQAERLAASEADRAARLDVINEQAGRLAAAEADRTMRLDVARALIRRLDRLEAERDAIRRDLRASVVLRRTARALQRLFGKRVAATSALEAEAPPAPVTTGSVAFPGPTLPGPPAIVYGSLHEYQKAVDAFTRSRPGLEPVRLEQHHALDVLHGAVSLAGKTAVEVGHPLYGYGLERCLALGVVAYTGIGEAVREVEVQHGGSQGRLVAGCPSSLELPTESVDVAIALSFQRLASRPAVLRGVHRALRRGGVFFIHCRPLWTSSIGHGLEHLPEAPLIPPWGHLVWTPEGMRGALAGCWPTSPSLSLDDAVRMVYESSEATRLDGARLHSLLKSSPFEIEWMAPLREDADDKLHLAACVARALGCSADELITVGYSSLLRKV